MAVVKQVRVLRNVLIWSALCLAVLWLVRGQLWEHRIALLLGMAGGLLYAPWHWRRLSRHIARRDRRFERNKIFVQYLNTLEILLSVMAYNHYLAILLAVALVAGVLFSFLSGSWWIVLLASFGAASGAMLAVYVIRDERRHGSLYYQYDSRRWSGAEGLIYRTATVVRPLTPAGKVDLQGELWDAVSISGDPIQVGTRVEVISVDRLTLYVDTLADSQPP